MVSYYFLHSGQLSLSRSLLTNSLISLLKGSGGFYACLKKKVVGFSNFFIFFELFYNSLITTVLNN